MEPIQVVLQFLKEEGYNETFETLLREAECKYLAENYREHVLRQSLGELSLVEETASLRQIITGSSLTFDKKLQSLSYGTAPVAMINIDDYIIVSFTDGVIKKLDKEGNLIKEIQPLKQATLAFVRKENNLYFGTISGQVAQLSLETFEVVNTCCLPQGSVMGMTINGDLLFVASRSSFLGIIDVNTMTMVKSFQHSASLTAICSVEDGIIYSIQNDSAFHFRPISNIDTELFLSMNPNEFDVGGVDIRDMRQSPSDPKIFVALTDQCRAVVYKKDPNSRKLSVLKIITHMISDGLTQPQLLWQNGPIIFSTSDDNKVVAISVADNALAFEIDGWTKSTRCLALSDDILFVGSFDKTISIFKLNKVNKEA